MNTNTENINYSELTRNLTKVNYHLFNALEASEAEVRSLKEKNLSLQIRNDRLHDGREKDGDALFDLRTENEILSDRVEELERIAKHHGALCTRCGTLLILSKYNDPNNPYDADALEDHLGGLCSSCVSDDRVRSEAKNREIGCAAGAD